MTKPRMTKTKTKKDLLDALRLEVVNRMDFLFNKFRDSVNEAMEVNQQRVYQSHLRVAQVVDVQNDRLNALVDILIDTKVMTEEEFFDAVRAAQEQRIAQIRAATEARELAQKEAAEKAEAEKEAPLTEESMVLEAGTDTPADGPQGYHPPEVEVFGG